MNSKQSHKFSAIAAFVTAAFALLLPVFVHAAATMSISGSLPGMTANPANPGSYIQSFYALALMLGGVLAFGAVVYGGVLYAASAGNPSRQSEGKEWIFSALTGLLLLAGAWLVLNTINPDLTNVAFPSLSNLSAVGGANGYSGGGTNTGAAGAGSTNTNQLGSGQQNCHVPSGSGACASVSNLSCFGSNAQKMQVVCNQESSNNTLIGGDQGADGNMVSWGLFQINLTDHKLPDPYNNGAILNCPAAFSGEFTGVNHNVRVVNPTLYAQCKKAAQDPTTNINTACGLLSNANGGLGDWANTAKKCGL